MKKNWYHLGRTLDRRAEADLKSHKIPFRKRIDIVLFGLFFSVIFLFILWWLIGVVLGYRFGLFDEPPIKSIADPRILANIRDNIEENPLLDAVLHVPEGKIYLSRKGGSVHRYDPSTGLWAVETPFPADESLYKRQLLNPDLILLRSGCGTDPLSNRVGECRDLESLWALTADNGLVRCTGGKWEVVKSDSTFTGSRGKPVERGQLTAAAISGNQEWLVVGTRQEGIGIYHLKSRYWLQLQDAFFESLPSAQVSHIAWCLDRFWIGGPAGLAALEMKEQTPLVTASTDVKGKIMDMDVDPGGGLWVLEKRNCQNGGFNCLGLYRFQTPHGQPNVLVDEGYIFPNLTLEDFHFARYWDNDHRLVVAGSAGIFSYDTRVHRWERHFRGDVTSVLPFAGENAREFYFGYRGGMGIVSRRHRPWEKPDKKCDTWMLPGRYGSEKIVKMHHGKKNEALGLTQSGSLFAFKEDMVKIVFTGDCTAVDPKNFRTAVAFGDNVLFTGDKKAMIHNIVTRGYKDVPITRLPEWLRQSDIQMVTSGDYVYAAAESKGFTHIYRMTLADAETGNFKSAAHLSVRPGPVSRMRDWDGQGIGLVAGDGRVFRFFQTEEALTGLKAGGMDWTDLLDAAPFQDGIIVAASGGLRYYDYRNRTWGRYRRPDDGSAPREVVQCKGLLLMSTQQGRLMELRPSGVFSDRIGGQRGFDMSDNELSDAMAKDDKLYLAGKGRINLYHTDLRQITDRWTLTGSGDVFIIDIIRGQPLALNGGTAFIGTQALDKDAGPVLNLSVDSDYIWTVRQKAKGANKYLKRYPTADPFSLKARCFFTNPYTEGAVGTVLDAAELPDGTVAVSFSNGLRFYSPSARSWHLRVQGDPIPRGGRLYMMGRHLVMAAERKDGFELTTVDTDAIQFPDSCSGDPVFIQGKRQLLRAHAVEPGTNRMAFIEKNGSISQWQGGIEMKILSPPGNQPLSSALKRVFGRFTYAPGFLLFTTGNGILRYDLQRRLWTKIPLNILLEGDVLKDINIEHEKQRGHEIIIAKTGKGKFFLGSVQLPADPTAVIGVGVRLVFEPSGGFGHTGKDILDVQARGGRAWTFVLKDRIKYYDPGKRQWGKDILIPGLTGSPRFCRSGNLGVVVCKDKENQDGHTWWVARRNVHHPGSFARYDCAPDETTALDDSGTIWRLLPDSTLLRLPRPRTGDYKDPAAAYERPFLLDAGKVKQAFKWGQWVLFDTTTGIRMLNRILRQEIPLTGPAGDQVGIKEILPDGDRAWIRTGTDRLLLLELRGYESGGGLASRIFPGKISGLMSKIEELKGETFSSLPLLDDQWSQLKQKVKQLPNGRQAYDPIIRLVIGSNRELMAQRPDTRDMLARSASLNIDTLPPPLDVGWLKWKRDSKTFEIKTPLAAKTLDRDDIVKEGKLIFEEVDALLAIGSTQLSAANRHGIWNHTRQDLSLNDPAITFQPVDWDRPIAAAHGRFITGSGIYTGGGKPLPQSQQFHRVPFGDVTLAEHLRQTGIEGRIKGIKNKNAFAAKGFTWDQNKRGLAYIRRGTSLDLFVHSDAGIHPVSGYTGFKPAPEQWRPGALAPKTTPTLVDNQTWKWELRNGVLRIRLPKDSYGFKPVVSRSGFGFTSDILLDAVTYKNRLYIKTRAFLEIADSTDQLANFQAPRQDNSAGTFTNIKKTSDPGRKRLLVDNPLLRITRGPSGQVKKEIRVKDITGNDSWQSFNFWNNRFPFDVITSTAADKDNRTLYLGTRAGLQVYSGNVTTGLNDMDAFYRLRGRSGEPLAAVEKVGIPAGAGNSDVVIAYSSGQCIEQPSGGTFRLCSTPGGLTRRLRVKTDFWRFIEQNGKLDGRYADQNGQFTSQTITIRDGRFPHDRIKDIAVFEGEVFALWRSGWISRQSALLSMALDKQMKNYNAQSLNPRRFIEAPREITFVKATAGQGLYVEGEGPQGKQRLWQYAPSSSAAAPWQEITDPEIVKGLVEYADRPPVINRNRLRLLSPSPGKRTSANGGEPFIFEQRTLEGRWQPLAWQGGCLGIDRWSEFLFLDDRLWAATPAGLISFSRLPGRVAQVVLDPDTFVVIAEPVTENKIAEITDMEAKDDIVTIRCENKSEQVFQGTLDEQKDRDVFTHLQEKDKDPFVRKVQVSGQESGFWQWVREECKDGQPGKLKGWLHGEEIEWVGGRFGFDSINSIAFFQEQEQNQSQGENQKKAVEIVEIGTDFNGWYRVHGDKFRLADFLRPKVPGVNPSVVKEVRVTRDDEGERILGLRTAGQGFIRLGKKGISGQTAQFPHFLCSDGFWRYMKGDDDSGGSGRLLITAASSNVGGAGRQMEAGRFTDDIVLGFPVSAADETGIYYLVPTRAGVLRLDQALNSREIYLKESLKSPDGKAPSVLFPDHRSNPERTRYLVQTGSNLLSSPGSGGEPFSPLKLPVHAPEGAVVLAVEDGPQDFLRVRWETKKQRGWSLLNLDSSRIEESNSLYVNLREFEKFYSTREKYGKSGTEPWMRVRFIPNPDRLEFLLHGADKPYRMDLPEPLNLLSALVKGKRLLLIGKVNLWEINLDHAMVESFKVLK